MHSTLFQLVVNMVMMWY